MNMEERSKVKEKYCGNCRYHNILHYPDKIFCVFHFLRRKNPKWNTLDVCENWELDYQECFCVKEALEKAP